MYGKAPCLQAPDCMHAVRYSTAGGNRCTPIRCSERFSLLHPQVACYASQHIKVQKEAAAIEAAPESHAEHAQHSEGQGLQGGGGGGGGGRITTVFRRLEAFEERCEEVAAMLGESMDGVLVPLCGCGQQDAREKERQNGHNG